MGIIHLEDKYLVESISQQALLDHIGLMYHLDRSEEIIVIFDQGSVIKTLQNPMVP